LIEAARLGHRNVVETLLDSGANVNAHTKSWSTALMAAKEKNHSAVVDLLVEARAEE